MLIDTNAGNSVVDQASSVGAAIAGNLVENSDLLDSNSSTFEVKKIKKLKEK